LSRRRRAQAGFENPFAALLVDVFFQVAGQRGDDFDAVCGEEVGQVLETGLFEDGQVAAVDHAQAARARRHHQAAEPRIEFRRAAGEIDGGDAGARSNEIEHRGRWFRPSFPRYAWARH
jgi:hypothetical protein